jgi:hypothetical protein
MWLCFCADAPFGEFGPTPSSATATHNSPGLRNSLT